MSRALSQVSLVSFSAGELSPLLHSRIDLEQYDNGARSMKNAVVSKTGGFSRRPGLEYIEEAGEAGAGSNHSGVQKNRLIPFVFSRDLTYMLELVPGGLYVHGTASGTPLYVGSKGNGRKWGALLLAGSEVGPSFDSGEQFEIQYAQINDVMYFAHRRLTPHKLIRLGDENWVLLSDLFNDEDKDQGLERFNGLPPMGPRNEDEAKTVTIVDKTAVSGEPYVTSNINWSGDVLGPLDERSYLRIGYKKPAVSIRRGLGGNGESDEELIFGDYSFVTTGQWSSTVELQRRMPDSSEWEVLRRFKSNESRNINATGDETEGAFYKIVVVDYIGHTGETYAYLENPSHIAWAYVYFSLWIDEGVGQGIIFKGAPIAEIGVATDVWEKGAWGIPPGGRGFPGALTFFENRLCFGGSINQPQTVWASAVDYFENFELGSDDDRSYAFTFAASERNAIAWMINERVLLIGTNGAEWELSSGRDDEIVTPTNVRVRKVLNYGSDGVQPFAINDVVMFVERRGQRLREMVYAIERDGWTAPEMTLLSDHITGEGIIQLAIQRTPETIVWAVTSDGQLIGMTYERAQNVTAWHRHETDGLVESVAVLPAPGRDEVWVIVNRGGDRFIERITIGAFQLPVWTGGGSAPEPPKLHRGFFLDSGKSYFGPAATNFTDMTHLAGRLIHVLADGVHYDSIQVNGSGEFTLPTAAELVHAGLPYTTEFEPMRLDRDQTVGVTIAMEKRIREIVVRFLESYSLQWSDGQDDFREMNFDEVELFSGNKKVPWLGNFDMDPRLILRQSKPYPFHLLAVVAKYELTGR